MLSKREKVRDDVKQVLKIRHDVKTYVMRYLYSIDRRESVKTNAFMKWTQSKALLLCPHITILLVVNDFIHSSIPDRYTVINRLIIIQ